MKPGDLVQTNARETEELFWLVGGEEQPNDSFWNDVPYGKGVALVIDTTKHRGEKWCRIMAPRGIGWIREKHLVEVIDETR